MINLPVALDRRREAGAADELFMLLLIDVLVNPPLQAPRPDEATKFPQGRLVVGPHRADEDHVPRAGIMGSERDLVGQEVGRPEDRDYVRLGIGLRLLRANLRDLSHDLPM